MSNRSTAQTPVLFSTPLFTLAERQSAIPDMSLMSSRMRRPMWVDEIRFVVAAAFTRVINLGYTIRCKLNVGRTAITSTRDGGNHVPVWNFGPALHHAGFSENAYDASGTTPVVTGHFRWKLPKPMYLPPGQSLTPSFYRTADGWGGNVYAGIAVVGRDLGDIAEPAPVKTDVPYVAYYEPTGGQSSAISSELDLTNPFVVPLAVQRFIGRQLQTTLVGGPGATPTAGEFGGVSGNATAPTELYTDIASVQLKDSYGQNVTRDLISFGNAFDPLSRGWTFQRILQPKERYLVQLQSILNASNYPSGAYTQPMISMIGWREEML